MNLEIDPSEMAVTNDIDRVELRVVDCAAAGEFVEGGEDEEVVAMGKATELLAVVGHTVVGMNVAS